MAGRGSLGPFEAQLGEGLEFEGALPLGRGLELNGGHQRCRHRRRVVHLRRETDGTPNGVCNVKKQTEL